MLVALEGIAGAGKTTLLAELSSRLCELSHKVFEMIGA